MLSVDELFDTRIGLGRAQYTSILCLCLIDMNDGAQLVLSSFLNPIVKREWGLSSGQVQNMSSIFYLGTLFGSLLSGKFSDYYGRRPIIIGGSVLQFIMCCAFAFVSSYGQMLLARFLYGFTFGLTIVLTTSMYSEIVPTYYRGKGLLLINFCVSLGKVLSLILAYIFLDNFNEGDWKSMMMASSLPSLIVVAGAYFRMYESPRFLLAKGSYDQSFFILNRYIELNQSGEPLNQIEKEQLKQWQKLTFLNVQIASIQSIFEQLYLKTTLYLSGAWFMVAFMYYGQLIILPFIFGKEQVSFTSYVLTICGEAPTLLVSFLMVDRPGFGRRRSLTIFFGMSGVLHLLFTFNRLTLFSSGSRFFMKLCFQMLYPFTTESYGTLNRTIGFGFCAAMGRVGSTIMPYILFPLLDLSSYTVFLSFVFVSFMGMLLSNMVPRDTLGVSLDENKKDRYHVMDS